MTVRILFQSVRILEKFVHSAPCVKKYLAIDSGGCLCENEFVLHQQDDLVLPTDLVWCLIELVRQGVQCKAVCAVVFME